MGRASAWPGAARWLSKYHAVFLPAGAFLYIVLEPSARRVVAQAGALPGGLAIGLGGVLAGDRLERLARLGVVRVPGGSGGGEARVPASTPWPAAIGGQAAYLFPWIWFGLVALLIRGAEGVPPRGDSKAERFLVCQSVAPAGGVHGGGLRPARPAALDPGRLPGPVPATGPAVGIPLSGKNPRKMGRVSWPWRRRCRSRSRRFLVVEYRTGMLQVGGFAPEGGPDGRHVRLGAGFEMSWGAEGLLDDPNGSSCSAGAGSPAGTWPSPRRDSERAGPVLQPQGRPELRVLEPARGVGRPRRHPGLGRRRPATSRPAITGSSSGSSRWAGSRSRRAGGSIRQVRLYRCVRQLVAFPFLPGDPDPSRSRMAAELAKLDPSTSRRRGWVASGRGSRLKSRGVATPSRIVRTGTLDEYRSDIPDRRVAQRRRGPFPAAARAAGPAVQVPLASIIPPATDGRGRTTRSRTSGATGSKGAWRRCSATTRPSTSPPT